MEPVKTIMVAQAGRSLPHSAGFFKSLSKCPFMIFILNPSHVQIVVENLNHLPAEDCAKPLHLSPCYRTVHLLAQKQLSPQSVSLPFLLKEQLTEFECSRPKHNGEGKNYP